MKKTELFHWIDEVAAGLREMAADIWDHPELAFQERHAAGLQASFLEAQGFRVQKGLPGIPTALVAEFGSGRPILGILGEYDALANLSQKKSVAHAEPAQANQPGHGCGHNLLGTAGVGAVLAIKKAMEQGEIKGTVRYYGCPAEETLAGKVFMAKEGAFADLDASLSWHPASMNVVWGCSFLAMNSVEFHFKGVSAHAAAAPQMGRSALDAVELMNVGANYLREHIEEKARLHYTITNGGGAPNIVPADASVWYYIRAPRRESVEAIYQRLLKIAQGAALMTETEVRHNLLAGCYDVLSNETLSNVLHRNMEEVGGPYFSADDKQFAEKLAASFTPGQKENVMRAYFAPPAVLDQTLHEDIAVIDDRKEVMAGSTDVGDVSWLMPFALFTAATWPVGTAAHSWQATASSGSGIGAAAMLFAAKALAGALYDLYTDDLLLCRAKQEFSQQTKGFVYQSPLAPGAQPPNG
ncbi:MAG TPA: amidohydrolase [Patescibacteria group bacterium]|nr:amidohydrolase [Patescibacteria group bacterium]